MLNKRKGEPLFPAHYIIGLSKRRSKDNFIFHVKIYQLTKDRKNRPVDPSSFIKTLNESGWKIIYLRRRNKVMHALSSIIAEERGSYHKFDSGNDMRRIMVNCDDITRRVKARFMHDEQERSVLKKIEYHEVVYEDDLENSEMHQRTANRIFDYLGLEKRYVSTQYRKINTLPLEKLISNYDEFIACLSHNQWQYFIRGE